MKLLRYAILGTGAVGGYYGSRLLQSGLDVHFLAHSDYSFIRQNGLYVFTPRGHMHFKSVRVYRHVSQMPKCDVVLVTLKATKNHLLARWLPKITQHAGLVVLLQNGFGYEEKIAQIVPHAHVAGGLAFLCATKIGPGKIRHLDYGTITFAPYAGRRKPRRPPSILRHVVTDFRRAGVATTLLPDLVLARWKKLVWNIPFNGLSVLHRARTDQLVKKPSWRAEVEALMREVRIGALALGRRISQRFLEKMIRDTEKMKPYRTSMKVDFDRGRPMEIEAIYGNPLRAAQAAGAHLPGIEKLYRDLKELQRENRRRHGRKT